MTDRVTTGPVPGPAEANAHPAGEAAPDCTEARLAAGSSPPGDGSPAAGTAADAGRNGSKPPAEGDAPPSLEDALGAARQAAERNREQLLRVAADFDNFRKRTLRDLEDARRRGRQAAVRELLPVFDNLERATNVGQVADANALRDGLRLVHRQFLDALKKLGIERIDPVGAAFDPTQHESIHLIESADHAAGTIVSVVQPGYHMGAELLRPAMVVVSKGPPAAAAAGVADGAPEAAAASPTEPALPDGGEPTPSATGGAGAGGSD
jgi:molecular chaperone GrpE